MRKDGSVLYANRAYFSLLQCKDISSLFYTLANTSPYAEGIYRLKLASLKGVSAKECFGLDPSLEKDLKIDLDSIEDISSVVLEITVFPFLKKIKSQKK